MQGTVVALLRKLRHELLEEPRLVFIRLHVQLDLFEQVLRQLGVVLDHGVLVNFADVRLYVHENLLQEAGDLRVLATHHALVEHSSVDVLFVSLHQVLKSRDALNLLSEPVPGRLDYVNAKVLLESLQKGGHSLSADGDKSPQLGHAVPLLLQQLPGASEEPRDSLNLEKSKEHHVVS